MKNVSVWAISALAGLIFILLLNASPISRLGLSIELPAGWQNAPVELYHNCSQEESKDPNANHCSAPCNPAVQKNEGLPFSSTRQNEKDHCFTDANGLALLLNALTGIVLGVIYVFANEKRWARKQK